LKNSIQGDKWYFLLEEERFVSIAKELVIKVVLSKLVQYVEELVK